MKNINKQIFLILGLSLLIACTSNFNEINQNPYGTTKEEMQRDGYSLRAALLGQISAIISVDVNTTQFTECLLGGPMAGYMADGNANFENTISNYNPTDNWTNVLLRSDKGIPVIYSNYRSIKNLTEDEVIRSVSTIVKVAYMHRVTDTYGPIPYSQIKEDGKIQVPYDTQEEVYTKMLEELDACIKVLEANLTNDFSSDIDILFGGKVEKWAKYANSLKLRLAMRISYAKPELSKQKAEEVAKSAVGTIDKNEDIPAIKTFGKDGNPINVAVKYNEGEYHNGGDSKAAADIICYMNGYKDPRRSEYFTKSLWGNGAKEYVGLRHGIIIPELSKAGYKYSGVKIKNTSPLVLMNAAEVAFLKAEAVAVFGYNMGGSAKDFYEQGIRLSFEQWGVSGVNDYLSNSTDIPDTYVDPSGRNSYVNPLSSLSIAWNENATIEEKQERIMIQKWIANWLLGNESWADIRRTGYPHIIPASELGNKSKGIVNSNLGARRMPYPMEEYTTNAINMDKALESLGGADNMSTRLWFDCKNK